MPEGPVWNALARVAPWGHQVNANGSYVQPATTTPALRRRGIHPHFHNSFDALLWVGIYSLEALPLIGLFDYSALPLAPRKRQGPKERKKKMNDYLNDGFEDYTTFGTQLWPPLRPSPIRWSHILVSRFTVSRPISPAYI